MRSFGACCTCSADRPFVLKDSTGKWRTELQSFSEALGTGTTSCRSFECEESSAMLNDFAKLIKNGIFFAVRLLSVEKENFFLFRNFLFLFPLLHPCFLWYACTYFMFIQLPRFPFFVYWLRKSVKWSKFYFHLIWQHCCYFFQLSWELNLSCHKHWDNVKQ